MKHKNDLIFNNKFNGKPKFGFRKLTVGLAAVTLGTAFFLENGQLVQADTQNNPESVSQVKTKAKSQHPKADEVSNPASADFNKQTDTTLKSNDKAPATNNTLKASITDSTLNDNDKETSLDVKKRVTTLILLSLKEKQLLMKQSRLLQTKQIKTEIILLP